MTQRPDSPCVALCSTAIGDNICRGCARRFEEIAQWCFMDSAERETVWQALPMRQRGLKVASALGNRLPEIERHQDQEWLRLPDFPLLYRLEGSLLWWWKPPSQPEWQYCADMSPNQVADCLRQQNP